jgi:general secretion pathway protein I
VKALIIHGALHRRWITLLLPKSSMSPFSGRPRGFTLIEVLVALLIVSLGMLGVIEAVGQAASNSSYLRDKTIAHWVALNRLTELRLQRQPPARGESSGNVEMAGQQWHWESKVIQTEVASMQRIDISVRRKDAAADSQLTSITGFIGSVIAQPGSTQLSFVNGGPQPLGQPQPQPPPQQAPLPQVPSQ